MHQYLRLLTRVTDTPLLISQTKLAVIADNVLLHLANGTQYSTSYENTDVAQRREQTAKTVSTTDVKQIKVFDTLQAKGGFGGLSGFTTYESIKRDISAAIAEGYSNVMLNIDSLGGEVTGLFELTSYIREQVAAGINIFSYVDGAATSAAYGIAAATKNRYVTETSIVGSIGAIIMHLETSKADAQKGYTYSIFRSKPEKALGDSHTPLSDTAIEKIQLRLANADTIFNNDILLSMPKLSLQSIIDMKGSEFIASEALQLGLVDQIVTGVDSALKLALPTKTAVSAKPVTLKLKSKEVNMTVEELTASLETANATIATLQANLATANATQASAVTAERDRIVAILEASQTLKVGMNTAMAHIAKGYTKDISLEIQTAIAESLGNQTNLQGAGNQGTIDPDITAKTSNLPNSEDESSEQKMNSLRSGAKMAGFSLRGAN